MGRRDRPEHLAAARRNPAPFLAASCLGFFVNLASLAVIQHAGSMTLKIVSQLKNVVVICAAVAVYDDVVSALELAGYAIAICGFGMYQDAKNRAAEFVAAEAEARGGEFRSAAGDGASETAIRRRRRSDETRDAAGAISTAIGFGRVLKTCLKNARRVRVICSLASLNRVCLDVEVHARRRV